jgi:hypothetical protein
LEGLRGVEGFGGLVVGGVRWGCGVVGVVGWWGGGVGGGAKTGVMVCSHLSG